MTEQEYINVRDLSNVNAMQAILHDIVAANSTVITREEYATVKDLLYEWSKRLHEVIEITHDA